MIVVPPDLRFFFGSSLADGKVMHARELPQNLLAFQVPASRLTNDAAVLQSLDTMHYLLMNSEVPRRRLLIPARGGQPAPQASLADDAVATQKARIRAQLLGGGGRRDENPA